MTEQQGPANNRRKTVKLGRKFAGSLATRLDAHPQSSDTERIEDENKILSLMRDVLLLEEPDPVAVNFITHAVEVHTATYGFSKVIYDELFRLHQARLKRPAKDEEPPPRAVVPPKAATNTSPENWKLRRSLKA
jgi:hypothetical protein